MEKIVYDIALDDVIDVIRERADLYEVLDIIDVVCELETLIEIISDMKYYRED